MLRCNATILAMEPADEPPMQGDISIAGDRIAAIAPDLEPSDGEEVIDATGRLVIPSLVDTHRHIREGILRGTPPRAPWSRISAVCCAAQDCSWRRLPTTNTKRLSRAAHLADEPFS